jgi:hypothetical protein
VLLLLDMEAPEVLLLTGDVLALDLDDFFDGFGCIACDCVVVGCFLQSGFWEAKLARERERELFYLLPFFIFGYCLSSTVATWINRRGSMWRGSNTHACHLLDDCFYWSTVLYY